MRTTQDMFQVYYITSGQSWIQETQLFFCNDVLCIEEEKQQTTAFAPKSSCSSKPAKDLSVIQMQAPTLALQATSSCQRGCSGVRHKI
jgi:hypothetical protein